MPQLYSLPRVVAVGGLVERLGVMLNRHEAEGPRGWQQDQTHRGQSSLKRPGWGGGPQVFSVAVSTWVFDRKTGVCLESMHIIMTAYVRWHYTPRGGNEPAPFQCDGGRTSSSRDK